MIINDVEHFTPIDLVPNYMPVSWVLDDGYIVLIYINTYITTYIYVRT